MRLLTLTLGMTLLAGCGQNSVQEPKPGSIESDPSLSLTGTTACGTVLAYIDGIEVFSNGPYTGSGNSCAGMGGYYGYQYQCKELVMRYFMKKFDSPRVYCDAKDCLEAFGKFPEYLTYKNGSLTEPRKGDALVFTGGQWGHIAMITEVTRNQIYFVQQNTSSAYGHITYQNNWMGNYGSLKPKGFIRHKSSTNTSNIDKAKEICNEFGIYSEINTCERGLDGKDSSSNILYNCQDKKTTTCRYRCEINTLGSPDFCIDEDGRTELAIENDPAEKICAEFSNFSSVNTCARGLKNSDPSSKTLYICKEKRTVACENNCVVNILGKDDYCGN